VSAKTRGGRKADTHTASIEFDDNALLAELVGPHGRNLAHLERRLGVHLHHRGNRLTVTGGKQQAVQAAAALKALYGQLEDDGRLSIADLDVAAKNAASGRDAGEGPLAFRTPRKIIRPRTGVQGDYAAALKRHELVLGIGPAGTGKTYLAVAAGIAMLSEGAVDKLILSRPAVEAGEKLGFLPGSMEEKVDPYLRPLYDALQDMLPGEQITRRREAGEIEVAPLAFMRGRTLSNAFVILDEAQNTTPQQMKMFLTRLGEGSRMVVTGDPSQVDLPRGQPSGLDEAREILKGVDGVGIVTFSQDDVVRHPLVQKIVRAYDAHDRKLARRRED
jgi:phosphate starvation-inducible protein PhoH and related proteins